MGIDADSPDSGHAGQQPGGYRDEGSFADVMNSFSFDSGRSKRRKRGRRSEESAAPQSAAPQPVAPESGTPQPMAPQPPTWPPGAEASAASTDPTMEPVEPPVEDVASAVRPYAWTRGRTRSEIPLELETLISTSDLGRQQARNLQEEHYAISSICVHPRSVAEIAALLGVPLGVARVLVGDMAESGLVIVHETASVGDDYLPNLNLMERVLSGLRRL